MNRFIITTIGSQMLFHAICLAGPPADLLDVARAANLASRQAIRTLSGRIRVETTLPESSRGILADAKYYRTHDNFRIIEVTTQANRTDIWVRDGEIRSVSQRQQGVGQGRPASARRKSGTSTSALGYADAWGELLLGITDANGRRVSYERFYDTAEPVGRAKRVSHDGVTYVVVQVKTRAEHGTEVTQSIWYSISKNYLVGRLEGGLGSEALSFSVEVTEWLEPQPGVHIPVKCVWNNYRSGQVIHSRIATLTDVVLNKPIADQFMRFPTLPHGTVLKDDIAGVQGPVDSVWRPIGKMEPVPEFAAAPPAPSPTGDAPSQSTSEAKSTGFWVAAASAAVVLGGVAVMVYRRLRTGRDE